MMDDAETHLGLRTRLMSVAELPTWRAWENVRNGVTATPPVDASHLDERYEPTGGIALTTTARNGWLQYEGLYLIGVHGLTNKGDGPIREICQGILTAFPPRYAWLLDSGNRIEIYNDNMLPYAGPILPVGANKSRSLVTIPWRVWTQNSFPAS